MEEKKIISSGSMTGKLIGWSILYGLCLGILYTVIFNLLTGNMENIIIVFVIGVILQTICAYFMWYCSISSSFKKTTIVSSDFKKVVRNILIYTIILLIIYACYTLFNVENSIDEAVEESFGTFDLLMRYGTDEQIIEYQQLRNQAIDEVTSQVYIYATAFIICVSIAYIAMVFVTKNSMKKHLVENQNSEPVSSDISDINNIDNNTISNNNDNNDTTSHPEL